MNASTQDSKIRVVVAEDSPTVRKYIVDVIASEPGMEVVAEAENGKRAVELCREYRPDVVTMDIVMPEFNGLDATEQIMAYVPTPILIISSSDNRKDAFQAYDAILAGAVDLLEKPLAEDDRMEWDRKLVSMIRMASRIRVITHLRGKLKTAYPQAFPTSPGSSAQPTVKIPSSERCVAIGASTGGPSAVLAVLRSLTPNFPLPVFLVIHIGEQFGVTLTEWLSAASGMKVRTPKNGELVPTEPNTVLMAPPNQHMEVRGGRVWLLDTPERHSCRPSVDVLFESLAVEYGSRMLACLLTGMGKDGAAGLLKIRQAGGETITQDEATSVIFGMPREAIQLGGARKILPLNEIGPEIVRYSARVLAARK